MSRKNWHILTEFRTQGVIKLTLDENSTEQDAMRIVFNMGHLPMRPLNDEEELEHNHYIAEVQKEFIEHQKQKGGSNGVQKKNEKELSQIEETV